MQIEFEGKCDLHCTDNDKNVLAEVVDLKPEMYLTVYVADSKIVMQYNKRHNVYIGSLLGREFTTQGPKFWDTGRDIRRVR